VKNILGPRSRSLLRDLAGRHTLLAFDFDGTLAPIVESRHHARLSSATIRVLRALSRAWPCAVISGRSRADVRSRLGGVRLLAVVGNHGAEESPPLDGAAGWRRQVRTWRRRLAAELAGVRGIDFEDKGLSLAVHVRGTAARKATEPALARLHGSRVVGGKRVLNLVVRDAPDKGEGLERIVRRGGYERVLFVGDDETDEDVFRHRMGAPLLGVSVGRRHRSAAAYYLRGQGDVVRLLLELVGLRPGRRHHLPRNDAGSSPADQSSR
jgi:trehalose 6-phosphate phosphatase